MIEVERSLNLGDPAPYRREAHHLLIRKPLRLKARKRMLALRVAPLPYREDSADWARTAFGPTDKGWRGGRAFASAAFHAT